MDSDLIQKFAPKRNHRLMPVPTWDEQSAWALSLDWRGNNYEFFCLCQALFAHLDLQCRTSGLRLDQLVTWAEWMKEVRFCADFHDQEKLAGCISLYRYLYISLNTWIDTRATALLEQRRQHAFHLQAA